MEARCIRCSTIVYSHKRLSELKCRCGGQLQRMRFTGLIEGLHPLGKEHNMEVGGKLCYGTYRSIYGNFVIDKLNNVFHKVQLLR